jgi:hypothetical protein
LESVHEAHGIDHALQGVDGLDRHENASVPPFVAHRFVTFGFEAATSPARSHAERATHEEPRRSRAMNGSPTTKAVARCAGILALALLLAGARANVARAGGDSEGGSSYGVTDLESSPTNAAPNRFEHGEHGGRGGQGDDDQGENGNHGKHGGNGGGGNGHHGGGGGGGGNPGGGGGGGPTGGGGGGPTQPVPEPSTMALAGMGLMAVAGAFRRRFRS